MHPYTRKGRAGAYSSIFFESLLEGTSDEIDSAYGLIAKEIEYPEDRSWVIFTLRNNVTFSDGSPLTAQDVFFSYNLLKQKGLPSFRAVLEKDVKNAELISDLKIKFTFNEDVPKRDLINTVGGLPIFSEKYFTDNKVDFEASTLTPALGSGPYILDKVDVGKQIIYKKNATYWVMISQLIRVDTTSINSESGILQTIIRRSKVLKALVHILLGMKHLQKYGLLVMISRH